MLVAFKRGLGATIQWLSIVWGWLHRKLWPGAPSAKLLYGALAAAIGGLVYVIVAGYWTTLNGLCSVRHEDEVTCGIGIHIVGTIVFGLLVFYLFFLRGEARAAAAWRFRARHEPTALFPWLPPPSAPPAPDRPGRVARMKVRCRRWLFQVMTGAGPREPVKPAIVSRRQLVSEIVRDVDDGAEPQILLGTTGTGKSLTLVELAGYLARRGQVPIAVSARGQEQLDFEELARDAYHRNVSARRADDWEKQWTWLRQRRLVTILVDELEKSKAQPHERVAALELAQRHELRLVAASRPDGLPTDFKRGRVQLEPLDEEPLTAHLAERIVEGARRSGRELKRDPGKLARDWVVAAGMATTPYYLALAGPLADICCLKPPPRTRNPRYELLTAYRAALERARLKPEAGLSTATRRQVVAGLEEVAYHRMLAQRTEREILDDRADRRWSGGLDLHAIVDGGRRLGLLNSRYDEALHFSHPTMLAYLASRYLRRHGVEDEAWRRLFEGEDVTPVMTRAMLFANADKPDPERVRLTCESLVRRVRSDREQLVSANGAGQVPVAAPAVEANGANPPASKHRRPTSAAEHERLSLIAAAAEILALAPSPAEPTLAAIVAQARKERAARGELAIATQRVVRAIGRVKARRASEALWSYAIGSDIYSVRREAIKALADGRGEGITTATEIVAGAVEQAFDDHPQLEAGGAAADDDGRRPFPTLKAAAWILPRLRTESRGQTRTRLKGLEERLLTVARNGSQRGLEASLAQGLKLDAMARPDQPIDPIALEMLAEGEEGARFWFSRVLAIQAVARRAVETKPPHHVRKLLQDARRENQHRFVRQAATLGLRAIDRGSWMPYIWNDMTDIASRSPRGIDVVATQLIGDMVLVLNLNEHGRTKQRQDFGEGVELPACLHESKDRREILGLRATTDACPFWHNGGAASGARCLCPYTYEYVQRSPTYRELSRSFCRHQRLNARQLPWQPELKPSALKEFWRGMENLAQF